MLSQIQFTDHFVGVINTVLEPGHTSRWANYSPWATDFYGLQDQVEYAHH